MSSFNGATATWVLRWIDQQRDLPLAEMANRLAEESDRFALDTIWRLQECDKDALSHLPRLVKRCDEGVGAYLPHFRAIRSS